MKNAKHPTTAVLACLAMLLMVGCATETGMGASGTSFGSTLSPCDLGEQKRVAPAMEAAKQKMRDAQCRSRYEEYYEELITVAASNPGEANYELFDAFITWGYEQNMLSNLEARKMFQEYFTTKFTALPADQNVCEASRNIKTLQRELALELEKKQRGLAVALGDRDGYDQAQRQMVEVLYIIESVGGACTTRS